MTDVNRCSICHRPMEGHGAWDACQSPERKLGRAVEALAMIRDGHGSPSALAEDTLSTFIK